MAHTTSFPEIVFLISSFIILVSIKQSVYTTAMSGPPSSGQDQLALNYLLFSSSAARQQQHESKLDDLLKDSNHSHVSDAVNLQLANSVWKAKRKNALDLAQQRANETRPTINRFLKSAGVSETCQQSLLEIPEHLGKLEQWAAQTFNEVASNQNNRFHSGREQQQQLEDNSQLHRFKYHLNHLRPPSLVPITVEQVGASEQLQSSALEQIHKTTPSADASAAPAPAPARVGRQLLQLQLPLQLHLKLRPLPLPMPPPPPPSSLQQQPSSALQQESSTTRASNIELPSEKRRRSTLDSQVASPALSDAPKSEQTNRSKQANDTHLLALAWREAKRILLMSSMMSPALLSHLKLERRASEMNEVASGLEQTNLPLVTTTTTSQPELQSPRKLSAESALKWTQLKLRSNTTPLSASPNSYSTKKLPLDSDREKGIQTNESSLQHQHQEIRRQRHSAQQQLQGQHHTGTTTTTETSDRQLLLATVPPDPAIMIPLLWPPTSQLYANQQAAGQELELRKRAAERRLPFGYVEVLRSLPEVQGSSASNDVVSAMLLPETSTPEQPRAAVNKRTKRRKPSYLQDQRLHPAGYPDSTRLASTYQMPKIKFQPPDLSRVSLIGQGKLSASISPQVPRSINQLIERQLSTSPSNYTTSTASHLWRVTSNSNSMGGDGKSAPTVSVTRTISSKAPHQFARGPNRQTSASTLEVTTSTPTTTTTTTTTPTPTPPTPTTTTTTTTTTTPSPAITTTTNRSNNTSTTTSEPYDDSNNRILPDESERDTNQPEIEQNGRVGGAQDVNVSKASERFTSGKSNANIKLFHFKRKPDMNKLPFYKRPLNYTELGWTPEQIEEHLALIAEQKSLASSSSDGELDDRTLTGNSAELAEERRQKRKRRGKNHFGKLMADLHGFSTLASTANRSTSDTEIVTGIPEEEARVPVLRKREDPHTAPRKPVFFGKAKQHKHRLGGRPALLLDTTTPTPTPTPTPTTTTSTLSPTSTRKTLNESRGKPIVRLRRKHHGDQPLVGSGLASGESRGEGRSWRANKPFWWAQSAVATNERLMLMPSGLLTPSGSQLVPLLAGPSAPEISLAEQNRLLGDLFSWRPSRNQQQQQQVAAASFRSSVGNQNLTTSVQIKPSAGLAPSGEENVLRAPSIPTANPNLPSLTQLQALQQQETRAPFNLLARPMRPAKYSLNGYIPKPTLNVNPQAALSSTAILKQNRQTKSRMIGGVSVSGKDLDSSTSNEVLSRRRGLQQHLNARSSMLNTKQHLLSFNNLLQSYSPANQNQSESSSTTSDVELDSRNSQQLEQANKLRQMEENKQKYIIQHQQRVAPTLSAHRAKLIKEKLGLLAVEKSSSQSVETPITDVTLKTTTLSQPVAHSPGQSQDLPGKQQSLANQQLNSIPKTDFECTDSKGKFIAGLFADHKTGCQVWHLCSNNRKYSFLCPVGTIFNAKLRICDWRYNVKCDNSPPF